MVPGTIWIVIFVGVLSAGAIIGALATALVCGRAHAGGGRLSYRQENFSLMASATTLTAETRDPAARDLARQARTPGAQAWPRLPR